MKKELLEVLEGLIAAVDDELTFIAKYMATEHPCNTSKWTKSIYRDRKNELLNHKTLLQDCVDWVNSR